MSTYKVSRKIFPSAAKRLKEVRLIQSNKTGLWCMSAVEAAMLLNMQPEHLSNKKKLMYPWSTVLDGPALHSLVRQAVVLQNYISVDTFCEHLLMDNEEKCNEFAQWRSAATAAAAASPKKRSREGNFSEAVKPMRKRISASPDAMPVTTAAHVAYEQAVRDWFTKNESQLQDQAIERLMQKEEVREQAIDRAAKMLAQLAQPSAKEMIDKLFD